MRTRGRGTRWLVGAICAGAFGCGSGLELLDGGATHGPIEIPPIEMSGVIFEGYHGDLRDLSVTAAAATVDMSSHVANLREVTIGFTAEDASKVQISAPVGQFHLDADDFRLSNGVRGRTAEGESFTTDAVRYIAKKRVIESDSRVELRRTNLVLTATGMELEMATHKLRLLGNVRAQVQPQ